MRSCFRLLSFSCGTLAIACGSAAPASDDPSGPAAATPTVAQPYDFEAVAPRDPDVLAACERYAEAAVRHEARCVRPLHPEKVAEYVMRSRVACLAGAVEPGLRLGAPELVRCAALLDESAADRCADHGVSPPDPLLGMGHACRAVVPRAGSLLEGAACRFDEQCASGRCSSRLVAALGSLGRHNEWRACGVCVSPLPEGAACDASASLCGEGLRCQRAQGCDGAGCPATCVPLGASCFGAQCPSGQVCRYLFSEEDFRCVTQKREGEPCREQNECGPSLRCFEGTCAKYAVEGEACRTGSFPVRTDSHCVGGLDCDQGTATCKRPEFARLHAPGESCGQASGTAVDRCDSGRYVCESLTGERGEALRCAGAPVADGAACTSWGSGDCDHFSTCALSPAGGDVCQPTTTLACR